MTDNKQQASILLIYTGGTIGMIENPETGVLEVFDFQHLAENVPELKFLGHHVDTYQFDPPLDSSAMGPDSWMKIVKIIADTYQKYDGFVILHGTDTMFSVANRYVADGREGKPDYCHRDCCRQRKRFSDSSGSLRIL